MANNLHSIGKRAVFYYKRETEYGVPPFPVGALNGVLAEQAEPGDTQLKFVSDPSSSIDAGNFIMLMRSDKDDPEIFKVGSAYTTGTTVPLDPNTPVKYFHEAGQQIVNLTALTGLTKLPGMVSISLNPNRPLIPSAELGGDVRGVLDTRPDVMNANGSIVIQIGISGSEQFLRDSQNGEYSQSGVPLSGGGSTTLSAGASKGATSVAFDSVASFGDGSVVIIGEGDTAEAIKIDDSWDEEALTIPLDTTLHPNGLRFAHAENETAVEVDPERITHIIKRGAMPVGLFGVLRLVDSDNVWVVRGLRFSGGSMSIQPQNNLITMTLNVLFKAVQPMGTHIFGAATELTHKPYVGWETTMKRGSAVLKRVKTVTLNFDQGMEADGYELGSPFRGSATEGDGSITGSYTYKFFDQSQINKILDEVQEKIVFETVYKAAGSKGQRFDVELPRAATGGSIAPDVPGSAPLEDTKDLTALVKAEDKTDLIFRITNDRVVIDAVPAP